MKFRKTLISIILIIAMAMTAVMPVYSVPFGDSEGINVRNSDFWPLQTAYNNARNSGDSQAIVDSGKKIMEYWLAGQTAEQRAAQWGRNVLAHGWEINDMWSVSYNVSAAYEKLGDLDGMLWALNIAHTFLDLYIELTSNPGVRAQLPANFNVADLEFSRVKIENQIASIDVDAHLYVELRDGTGAVANYGAMHEPKTGVVFGEPSDVKITSGRQKPSGTIIYVEYELEDMQERVEHCLRRNQREHGYDREQYSYIQVAWNFHEEGASLKGVLNDEQKITEAAKYLGETGLPILLRVGGEVDVWGKHPADPAEFIAAFRFIAGIMRREAPNVAMLWSVNFVSSSGNTWEMFYPGDEYVDWVGISLYTQRYFLGNPNTSDVEASIYRTGQYANPVSFVGELVEKYGDRKPIIISEGAVALINTSNNEDLTDWALPRMRQVYNYIPMLYPEVKGIFWFNTNIPGNQRYDFAASPRAAALYNELTAGEYFLGLGKTESPVTYKRVSSSITMPANAVTLLTYAPFYAISDELHVVYRLNGGWLGEVSDIPYRRNFNLSDRADGIYELTVHIFDNREHMRSVPRSVGSDSNIKNITYTLTKRGDQVTITNPNPEPERQMPAPQPPRPRPEPLPPPVPALIATPTAATVLVDGVNTAFDAYNIEDSNYFKLRDLAYVLNGTDKQFSVGWDGVNNAISLTSGQPYSPVAGDMTLAAVKENKTPAPTTSKIYLDGKEVQFEAYNIDGNNYFKLRDVMQTFDVFVGWDGATSTITLDTTRSYD